MGKTQDLTPASSRARYMDTLRPQWLGSIAEMQAFYARSKEERVDPDTLALLQAIISDEKGQTAYDNGDKKAATKYFKSALTQTTKLSAQLIDHFLYSAPYYCNKGLVKGVACR